MAYGIGRAHKLVKQNINRLYNTIYPSSAASTLSYIYNKLNENTDITSTKLLTSEIHSRKIFDLEDKTSEIITKKSASDPY